MPDKEKILAEYKRALLANLEAGVTHVSTAELEQILNAQESEVWEKIPDCDECGQLLYEYWGGRLVCHKCTPEETDKEIAKRLYLEYMIPTYKLTDKDVERLGFVQWLDKENNGITKE